MVVTLVNGVFINSQANMAAWAHRINIVTFFTNRKLPTVHSESVSGSGSKAIVFSFAEKKVYKHGGKMRKCC